MIEFRENEEKNCIFFFAPPPPTKRRKREPLSPQFFSSALKYYDEQLCQVLTV